jgi:hypothetical protein
MMGIIAKQDAVISCAEHLDPTADVSIFVNNIHLVFLFIYGYSCQTLSSKLEQV